MISLLLLPYFLFANVQIETPESVLVEQYDYATAVVIISAEENTRISKIKVIGGDIDSSDCVKTYYENESCVLTVKTYIEKDPKSCILEIHNNGKIKKKKILFEL